MLISIYISALLVCAAAIPVLVFSLEIILSVISRNADHSERHLPSTRPIVSVLVPAHNEEAVISKTLAGICAQLQNLDKLVVVADNCSDRTAEIAKKSGALVLERNDSVNLGKGFALDYGLQYMAKDPPDVLIIIDADCIIGQDLIERISFLAAANKQPVQALYVMEYAKPMRELSKRSAEFAWRVKNYARPLGLDFLGMPCQMMGSGMAIPFEQLSSVKVGSTNIVEDMQLGLDLAYAGFPPMFCSEVSVTSYFPETKQAIQSQRTRWVHGHIGLITKNAPRLLLKSFLTMNIRLLALSLDLIVPPLSMLGMIVLLATGFSGAVMLLSGSAVTFQVSCSILFLFVCSAMLAWYGYGRNLISLTEFLTLPVYTLGKIPIYWHFLTKRQKKWIRTKRD